MNYPPEMLPSPDEGQEAPKAKGDISPLPASADKPKDIPAVRMMSQAEAISRGFISYDTPEAEAQADPPAAKPGGEAKRDRLADAFIGKMHTVDNTGDCVPECWCQQHSPALPDVGELVERINHPRESFPIVPAAFINTISEEGTKGEAVEYLQKEWSEKLWWRDRAKEAAAALEASQREVEHWEKQWRDTWAYWNKIADEHKQASQEIERLRALLHEAINSPYMDNDADIGDWYDRVRAALERKGT